jgi:hypothetical protein
MVGARCFASLWCKKNYYTEIHGGATEGHREKRFLVQRFNALCAFKIARERERARERKRRKIGEGAKG